MKRDDFTAQELSCIRASVKENDAIYWATCNEILRKVDILIDDLMAKEKVDS